MTPINTSSTKKQSTVSADDFEDDFVEEEVYSDTNPVDEEDMTTTTGKRKADQDTKKKKNKKNKKKKSSQDPYHGIKIWTESPSVQAEYVMDRLKQALPSLTPLETMEITPEAIVDNTKFKQEHTMDALPNYVKFAVMRHKNLNKKPTGLGSPMAIIVTHAAMRAADLSRGLKTLATTARIAKLFAKHIKIQEQADLLNNTAIHLAVGTPQRLLALIEQGHLKLDQLEVLVMDTDTSKGNYNLMEQLSGREPLFTLLNTYIAPRMQAGTSKLALF
ncbi:U3-containing 90S pre-ribosomal complex subunit-domain containing protein, partial [Halteromyces radiatus]|uniref:U3-containing 90S pre-ribosomal complex subunit-domain containing protein n=1 Tax=Halteromyces radiatus TaxID=101107 RepID=UPI00221EBC7B